MRNVSVEVTWDEWENARNRKGGFWPAEPLYAAMVRVRELLEAESTGGRKVHSIKLIPQCSRSDEPCGIDPQRPEDAQLT